MVSFRHSQLQAMLVGMVIADALSWGQLPWPLAGATSIAASGQSVGAIARDRWCQAIAAQLSTPTWNAPGNSPAIAPPDRPTEAAAALLTRLPQVLWQLETPLTTADAATTALHACLTACLRQDAPMLIALQRRYRASSNDSGGSQQNALAAAIAIVLAAQGDFQLAVGQSLQKSEQVLPTVGLPVLTGILSAGWGDLASVPCGYRHSLIYPEPPLGNWLQRRWQIADGTSLAGWATHLWQRWLGMEKPAPLRRAVAVLPIPVV